VDNFKLHEENAWIYIGNCTFGQEETELSTINNFKEKYDDSHKHYNINCRERYYVVQTNPVDVINNVLILKDWYKAGIKYVELGSEIFDNSILKKYNKPCTVGDTLEAIRLLNDCGMGVILNVMINFPEETSSIRNYNYITLKTLRNSKCISHLNLFYYTDYKSDIEGDRSEINLIKSWNDTKAKGYSLLKYAECLYKLNYELLTTNY